MTTTETETTTLAHPTTHDVLLRTKDILNVLGWTQGTYEDKDGKVCLMGALCKAADLMFPAVVVMQRVTGTANLAGWNDDYDRTYEDVVHALDRALKETEPREVVNGA